MDTVGTIDISISSARPIVTTVAHVPQGASIQVDIPATGILHDPREAEPTSVIVGWIGICAEKTEVVCIINIRISGT